MDILELSPTKKFFLLYLSLVSGGIGLVIQVSALTQVTVSSVNLVAFLIAIEFISVDQSSSYVYESRRVILALFLVAWLVSLGLSLST
jgi:hypothetical protein